MATPKAAHCRVRKVSSREPSTIERTFYGALVAELVAARTRIGWSQQQLDDRLGVADGQVAKWESFARLPGAFMLMCWALAVDCKVTAIAERHKGESDEHLRGSKGRRSAGR